MCLTGVSLPRTRLNEHRTHNDNHIVGLYLQIGLSSWRSDFERDRWSVVAVINVEPSLVLPVIPTRTVTACHCVSLSCSSTDMDACRSYGIQEVCPTPALDTCHPLSQSPVDYQGCGGVGWGEGGHYYVMHFPWSRVNATVLGSSCCASVFWWWIWNNAFELI